MSFNDDEPIVPPPNSEPRPTPVMEGRVQMNLFSNLVAPFLENKQKVLVKLFGSESYDDRPPLDLVAVLDVSGSMENKIGKMKTAVSFVLKKLTPLDRVSIVTFSFTAARLIPLTLVTDASLPKLLGLVNGLKADGGTNITDGLLKGLQVLADRKFSDGRFGGVVLMSDGLENQGGDAAKVVIGDKVPVFTFGFGDGYDGVLLNKVANNSKGGTFNPINDINNLSLAFSQCLVCLLSVLVNSLKVTLTGNVSKGIIRSKILTVTAGSYDLKKDPEDGSFTIDFGVVYGKEVRTVIVELLLPAVDKNIGHDILEASSIFTFSDEVGDETKIASLTRISTLAPGDVQSVPEVEAEEARLNMVSLITAARTMADGRNLPGARKKLGEAKNVLNGVVDQSSPLIGMLLTEVNQLILLLQSQDRYEKEGRPFALSSETSHGLQRFAARGDFEKMRLFATPRMDTYLEQAKKFDKDPTAPVPTADEDVKEEVAANPLAPFAGPFTFYIQAAIQALQGLEKLINNGGKP